VPDTGSPIPPTPNRRPIDRVAENTNDQISIAIVAAICSEPQSDLADVPGHTEIYLPPFIVGITGVHYRAGIAVDRVAGSEAERIAGIGSCTVQSIVQLVTGHRAGKIRAHDRVACQIFDAAHIERILITGHESISL